MCLKIAFRRRDIGQHSPVFGALKRIEAGPVVGQILGCKEVYSDHFTSRVEHLAREALTGSPAFIA